MNQENKNHPLVIMNIYSKFYGNLLSDCWHSVSFAGPKCWVDRLEARRDKHFVLFRLDQGEKVWIPEMYKSLRLGTHRCYYNNLLLVRVCMCADCLLLMDGGEKGLSSWLACPHENHLLQRMLKCNPACLSKASQRKQCGVISSA